MKRLLLVFIAAIIFSVNAGAQSTNQDFPTPVNAGEISGAIQPRDVGDARLTRHFYTFFADNGDVDLKIETANFDGDIDLFEANTLRPLLKVTVYNNSTSGATARSIYFRKRAQVVLRVEGRALTDETARYRINFGGSFAAAEGLPEPPADSEPKIADKTNPNLVARVNSAGAIIEVLPAQKPAETAAPIKEAAAPKSIEPAPRAEETAADAPKPRVRAARRTRRQRAESPVAATTENKSTENNSSAPDERATDGAAQNPNEQNSAANQQTNNAGTPNPNQNVAARRANRNARRTANANRKTNRTAETTAAPAEPQLDPLANLRLVVLLKNNDRIERPMTDVFRVNVDKAQLTVITKNGKIERYNLVDVARFAIE